jgi:hypothetical protein
MEFCLNGRSDKTGTWASQGRGMYLDGGREVVAMLVDQRFLPRIVEGEVRCNIVGSKLVELVHKKQLVILVNDASNVERLTHMSR